MIYDSSKFVWWGVVFAIGTTNNSIENLHLFKNQNEHQKCHIQLEHIGAELFKRGIIGFENGKYFIK